MVSRILPISGSFVPSPEGEPLDSDKLCGQLTVLTKHVSRDHIKRVHSDKYGCSECKERYQCRDNSFAATEKKHKDECKQVAKGLLDVSHFKPEWMTPEEDRRYFKLDFRRMSGLNAEEQYFKICEAIWPGFSSRGLNICEGADSFLFFLCFFLSFSLSLSSPPELCFFC